MSQDGVGGVNRSEMLSKVRKAEAAEEALMREALQDESQEDVLAAMEREIYAPPDFKKEFKTLAERMPSEEVGYVPEEGDADESALQQKAEQYQRKNPELLSRTLMVVRSNLKESDDVDTLLGKVRNAYPDPSLADEAIDFLIEVSENNKALQTKLKTAKDQFNIDFGREIRAGRNIQEQAQEFATKGLGSPTALRDLYRDITGNPRDPNTLFSELNQKFSFEEMVTVVGFVLHSLGSDMKAKGPSIEPAELQRLFSEARTMQAIIGVYRFFQTRMPLIEGEFNRNDLTMPPSVNFKQLAKIFMQFIQDRYPAISKVFALAAYFGISEEVAAQIVIYAQFRDAMRNTSPKLYKGEKHRQGILMTLIEALAELEDLEEEEEDEDERYKDTLQ